MNLRYFLPRADLRDYVRAYYFFSTPVDAVLPMCAELGNIRILLDGDGYLDTPDGKRQRITSAFLIGPTNGAYNMDAKSGTRVFGVGIRPRGWGALLGIDAAEAADQVFDLTALAGRIARRAVDEIRNAPDMQEKAAAADRFFACMMERRLRRLRAYPEALEQWLLHHANLDLDRLIEVMDVSRRQTDRVAKQFFGASPKLLQRKYRALRAADRILDGDDASITGAGNTYYDHSHFIKEFRVFIGATPRQFLHNQSQLIAKVQDERKLENMRVPLASV